MKKIVLISYLLISSVFLIHSKSYETIKIEITKNLRCLVCQGQSIYDSDSEFANSIKLVVDKKLNEGSTKKEIYEFLKTKYGDWILYDPKWTKNTYLLWLIPILIFLFGGFLIFKKLKIR
jgi:cytochrome c-type biogenesis protein CcmH